MWGASAAVVVVVGLITGKFVVVEVGALKLIMFASHSTGRTDI